MPNFRHGSSPSGNSVSREVSSCQTGTGRKLLFLRGAENLCSCCSWLKLMGLSPHWIRPSENWTPPLLFHLDSKHVFSEHPHLNESPLKLFLQENNTNRGTVALVWQTDHFGVNIHVFSQVDWLLFRWTLSRRNQKSVQIKTIHHCSIKKQKFLIQPDAQGDISSKILCRLSTEKAPVYILYFTYIDIDFPRINIHMINNFPEIINIFPFPFTCILLPWRSLCWWLVTPESFLTTHWTGKRWDNWAGCFPLLLSFFPSFRVV